MTPARGSRAGRRRLLVPLAVLAAVAGLLAWVSSVPLGQNPDEPAHLTYAWGTVTGQTGPDADVVGPRTRIVVPETLKRIPARSCFDYRSAEATCPPLAADTTAPSPSSSYMTRYPPLYYALTGASLRLLVEAGAPGEVAVLATRLASGVLCLLLVGWGAVLLRRALGGLTAFAVTAVALTPMSWSMFASVNPNGVEIASAYLLAAAVIAVRAVPPATGLPSSLVLAVPVGATALAWSRPLSFVWAGLVLALLLLPLGTGTARSGGRRRPAFLRMPPAVNVVTVAVVLGAVGWFGWAVQTRAGGVEGEDLGAWPDLTWVERLLLVLYKFGDLAEQGVGLFGWGDTPVPQVVVLVWVAVTGTFLAVTLGSAAHRVLPRWAPVAVLVLGAGVVVGHTLLTAFGWQGRYVLAVTVATVVLAAPYLAAAVASPPARRLLRAALLVGVVPGHLVAILTALWRYVYGQEIFIVRFPMSSLPVGPARWEPFPGRDGVVLLALAAMLAAGVVAALASHTGAWEPRKEPDGAPGRTSPRATAPDAAVREAPDPTVDTSSSRAGAPMS